MVREISKKYKHIQITSVVEAVKVVQEGYIRLEIDKRLVILVPKGVEYLDGRKPKILADLIIVKLPEEINYNNSPLDNINPTVSLKLNVNQYKNFRQMLEGSGKDTKILNIALAIPEQTQ